MDRHRGDRYGDNSSPGNYSEDSYYDRRPSRFSDGPRSRYNGVDNYNRRSPSSYRVGSHRPFDSPPRRSPIGGGGVGGGGGAGFLPFGGSDDGGGGFRPLGGSDVAAGGGVGFRPMGSGGGGFGSNYEAPLPQPLSGQKRGFGGRGGSPDRFDCGSFAKLFVGSVPRTAIESDIRPLFEEHGNVIEVAFLKDKRTGQQQGCCFIKYATSAEADRAIRALHNLVTLPGGLGPIQVRYADGERERLGAVEYKLFVGSLNKQATEKEVEEIFSAYGRVEDVYLMRDEMRQSRGCGFVKYSNRDMALAAINALNGIFTMRGCDQPLTVRFADPKRPRPGESRGGPAYGGPGFGPRFQAPGPRPPPNVGEAFGDRIPPTAWHPMAQQNLGPSSNATIRGFGGQLLPRSGDLALPLNQGGPLGGPSDGNPPGLVVSSAAQQAPTANVGQLQIPHALGQTPFSQEMPSQHLVVPTVTNQQQLPAPVQQQVVQSHQQSSSQLAQMLSQQTQTLQATLRSSQQAFSELQQQWQMRQPSNQNLTSQHNFQVSKQQWPGIGQQTFSSSATTLPADVPPSTTSAPAAVVAQTVAPMKCNWTEHMSPEGFKYYYNSVTRESRWEKPEELTLFEQQQQVQQNPFVQQPQTQSNPQVLPSQQVLQAQPVQLQSQPQTQFQHHQSLQQPSFSSSYANSVVRSQQDARELGYTQYHAGAGSVHDPTRFQGHQATQELTWKNKPSGT